MRGRASTPAGFTLIEVMTAVTIGAIIVTGITSAIVQIYKTNLRMEQQTRVDEEAKLLLDNLLSEIQQVGGGSVRPSMVLNVEDDCAEVTGLGLEGGIDGLPDCDGSDRLTFVVLDDASPQCSVDGSPGAVTKIDQGSGCCDGTKPLEGHTYMIIAPDGGVQTRFCSNQTDTPGTCQCTNATGQSGYNPPGGGDTFPSGTIVMGTAVTLFLDRTTKVLHMLKDTDDNGEPEIVDLAPNVWDIQFDLGFDTDGDGVSETYQTDYSGVTREALRVIRVGLVVGNQVPSREIPARGTVLNGPERVEPTGHLLREVTATTGLRNLFLFF